MYVLRLYICISYSYPPQTSGASVIGGGLEPESLQEFTPMVTANCRG